MKLVRNIILVLVSLFFVTAYQNCSFMEAGFVPDDSFNGSSGTRPRPTPFPREDDELRAFFKNTVEPAFESNCMSCHNEPRNGGIAPLSIFNYDSMQPKLASGLSGQNNELINKMRDVIDHDGGNRCSTSGLAQSPCLEVVEWWDKEFGDGSSTPIASTAVTSITDTGRIRGYASDADDGAREIDITFYLDGPAGMGINIGTITANLTGPLGDRFQGHYFDFTIPDMYRDGSNRTLYVYADGTNAVDQVGPEVAINAYRPGSAGDPGFDYYEATVRPALQSSCGSCHTITYNTHFPALLSPSPAKGGTAMINKLINKAAGMDSHGGGVRCGGGKNSSPCSLLQEWWDREFGP